MTARPTAAAPAYWAKEETGLSFWPVVVACLAILILLVVAMLGGVW